MAKYFVRGVAVENAEEYELAEKYSDGTYSEPLATANEINFEVSAMGLAVGEHSLVVRATTTAEGFENSDYSDPVTYTADGNVTYTVTAVPNIATVKLEAEGYTTVTKTGSASITVAVGTTVNWSVSADGYTEQNGTYTISGGNKTENVILSASYEGGAYWISEKLTGKTIGSGQARSLLGSQYFVIRDETYISELAGKTVESVAVCLRNTELTNGSVKIYLVDRNNEAPGNWVLKDTITGWAGAGSTIEIKDLNTPFVVPSGYTIGYQGASTMGGGTVTEGYSREDYYYSSLTAEEATKITMAPFDVKVSS